MLGFDPSKFAKKFCVETREKTAAIRVILEKEPIHDNMESLDEVRKIAHALKGVSNMLKFTTVGKMAGEMETALREMIAGNLAIKPWVHPMIDAFTNVVNTEVEKIESNPSVEQIEHPFLNSLKTVTSGGEFSPQQNDQEGKPQEEDKRFSKERFIKKFIEESEGYIKELKSILNFIKKNEDLESRQNDLKNVVHAFKGSSKLLGFTELHFNLEKLEDFLIDNIKAGKVLPANFKTSFSNVILSLQTNLNRISSGDLTGEKDENLTKSIEAIVYAKPESKVIPVVPSTPIPEKQPELQREEKHADDSSSSSKGKKFDRSIFISKFVDESLENNEQLSDTLLGLEKNLTDESLIRECMRLAHILKGSARMMGFKFQGSLLHKMEDLFNEFVNNGKKVTEHHTELLFTCIDLMKENLTNIKREGKEIDPGTTLLDSLDLAIKGDTFGIPEGIKRDNVSEIQKEEIKEEVPTPKPAEKIQEPKQTQVKSQPAEQTPADVLPVRKFGDSIRVNTSKLDNTIKLVGELLVNRQRAQIRLSEFHDLRKLMKGFVYQLSGVIQVKEEEEARELLRLSERILTMLEGQAHRYREDLALQDLIINELQSNTIKMRMEPLNVIFNAYPRAIRDISKSLNKQVELVIQGEETELDRKMIEKLNDPLIHLLRNAIDHGIESPEEREKAGKPVRGLIRIQALTEGSNIVLHVEDDGGGIDIEKIKQKALQKKMFRSEEELEGLNEFEIMKLIFMPNFSTAAIITDISGRGVGLDIVKKNIEDMKGYISVDSILGSGTKFTIKLPLTLTTIRSLICLSGNQKWSIPISSIKQTLILDRNEVIEVVDRDAIRLDNQIISLVRLSRALGLKEENADPHKLMIVVGYYGKEQIAFVVDDILEEIEVVIKPIPSVVHKVKNVSAVTVSLNGEIIPILFMPDLILSAKMIQEGMKEPIIQSKTGENVPLVLVVDDSLNTREIEKTILEAYGYRVETARDGLDGYEKAMETQYDVIVSDLEMPRLNGFGLIERLRLEPKYKLTPIIVVTSRENDNDKRRGIEVGANAYIIKGSFDQTSLVDTIESLLA